ncbi:aldolase/citrate lyase family protein [Sphingomonas profundi]|uniref:aldolase/citrate lyase family protein n=1 Tax=Alterirhizorhabdus profundi TaxID=2681549 RepID=UPI0018D039FE|nr:aldolase/citrate lyase family protein [Sphingomonas profundi]
MIPPRLNRFKRMLQSSRTTIGLFMALANGYTAEIAAEADFDWLMIDGEHGPNDLRSILPQIQALGCRDVPTIVRPVTAETWLIKQLLDIGAQTLLLPMVDTAEQAAAIVAASRYPPHGVRGVGASLARASRWNGVKDYLHTAADELCLIPQVETRRAIADIEAIAAVPGVDAVFIGPSDLAADMGLIGQPTHPEVRAVIDEAIVRVVRAGRRVGIFAGDVPSFMRSVELGVSFVAVGSDVATFAQGTKALATQFRELAGGRQGR